MSDIVPYPLPSSPTGERTALGAGREILRDSWTPRSHPASPLCAPRPDGRVLQNQSLLSSNNSYLFQHQIQRYIIHFLLIFNNL